MEAPGPGRTIGHYRLETFLGSGPMGVVYVAQAPHLRRPVAIKVLAPERLDAEARRRLRIDAIKLARLRHPNVARIFDCGSAPEHDYVVMEVVPGCSLEDLIRAAALEEDLSLRLAAQLARGLEAAHSAGVVDGSLTSGNVRVTPQHVLKILDFGLGLSRTRSPLASMTAGPVSGAQLRWLAPERLLGIEADERADIFSAGAILYEMFSGRPLYAESDTTGLIDAMLNRAPAPLSAGPSRPVDPRLEAIVFRAVDRNPNARFQSAGELFRALEALDPPSQTSAPGRPAGQPVFQRSRVC